MTVDGPAEDVNLANAVDLSESEEEEELEDIIDDFSIRVEQDIVSFIFTGPRSTG
jgi:DNA-directed RNA polymerase III subunit RPC4